MRYYEITLTKEGATTPYKTWSSQTNGAFNPSALQVEFDFPVSTYGSSTDMCSLTIHGVSMDDLRASQTFTGMSFLMKAGMQKGLPLAKPAQAGPIMKGTVFQSFGNWEGTDLSITFVISPTGSTFDSPGNFVLDWPAGTTLETALKNMLSVALPGMPVTSNISSSLVLGNHEQHYSSTLDGVADVVYEMTKGGFLGADYPGVNIAIQAGNITLFDQTSSTYYTQIEYTDLIGQPTWIDQLAMMVKLVMRADVKVGGQIKMPQGMRNSAGQVATTATSQAALTQSSVNFSGLFNVTEIRQIGDFRSPGGGSWATIVTCRPA